MYNVMIKPALNGWQVEVGCQTLVFNDMSTLLKELEKYLKDPEGVEKHYRENAINSKHTLPRPEEHIEAPPQPVYIGSYETSSINVAGTATNRRV